MTAPSYVNKAEYTWTGTSQGFTIPTVEDGDVGILITYGSTTTIGSHTHPTTPTQQRQVYIDVGSRTLVATWYWLLATDSAGTLTVNTTAATHCGVLLVYRGVTTVALGVPVNGSLTSQLLSVSADDLGLLVGACYRATSAAVLESSTGTERSDLTNSLVELEVHEVGSGTYEETWTYTNAPTTTESITMMARVCGTAVAGHVYKGRASASDDTTGAA